MMQETLKKLSARTPLFWLNPDYGKTAEKLPLGMTDILDAEARLMRFAPLLAELFSEPTRLLCPWDFSGKSTGVGCHCLLQTTCYMVPFV